MNQIVDPTIDALRQDLARFNATDDPKSYIAKAPTMLSAARAMLIRAEALHQAKRNSEIIKAKDALLNIDREHDKIVQELVAMIDKLEALRS